MAGYIFLQNPVERWMKGRGFTSIICNVVLSPICERMKTPEFLLCNPFDLKWVKAYARQHVTVHLTPLKFQFPHSE